MQRPRLRRLLKRTAFVVVIFVVVATMTDLHWTQQGGEVRLLPFREWEFGVGQVDGLNPRTKQGCGGDVIYYGMIERTPRATLRSFAACQ